MENKPSKLSDIAFILVIIGVIGGIIVVSVAVVFLSYGIVIGG